MSVRWNARWIAIAAVIFIAGAAGFFLPRLSNDWPAQTGGVVSGPIHDCHPGTQLCRASDGQHTIALMLPQNLRYLEKFPLQVSLSGFDTEPVVAVTVIFTMRDMDMGINRYRLTQTDAGLWKTEAVLPVCVTGRHDWIVSITVRTEQNEYSENFSFEVVR